MHFLPALLISPYEGSLSFLNFIKKFWDIVGQNVFIATLQFFKQGWLLPNLNSNLVVLIPKTPNDDQIEHFKPIALANYQFKKITKVLVDKISFVAPKLISPNQRGFFREMHMLDCVCTTFEAINMLNKQVFGGNLALKIDIKKAFDSTYCVTPSVPHIYVLIIK